MDLWNKILGNVKQSFEQGRELAGNTSKARRCIWVVFEGRHMMAASKSRHRVCVSTGLLTILTAARSAPGGQLRTRLNLFAPLLFSVSCCTAQPPWCPDQGHFPAAGLSSPCLSCLLWKQRKMCCTEWRGCVPTEGKYPHRVICVSVIASSQVLLCEIVRVACLDVR